MLETIVGNKYFFLLVDDISRIDEALGAFKNFCVQVEKASGKEIKVFRTDRGGKFVSKEFTTYGEEDGIIRHFTTP